MRKYLIRRLLQAIPTLFGVSLISFMLIVSAPGDPITMLSFNPESTPESMALQRRLLGIDQPPAMQYIYWLVGNRHVQIDVNNDGEGDTWGERRGILFGDFGMSIQHRRPVADLIIERIPATLQLTVTALVVSYTISIVIGLLAAVNHGGWFDRIARVLSVLGSVVPGFWLGLILIIIFSVNLRLLPMSGMRSFSSTGFDLVERIRYMILPVSVMSLAVIASVSRFVRASALETLQQDYVRTAYSKGLNNRRVWMTHVMRNALLPVATMLGPAIGGLLGGAVIIETVFSWPGMGKLAIDASFQRDYPLVMAFVMVGASMYIIGLLISDVLYVMLDPRIRMD